MISYKLSSNVVRTGTFFILALAGLASFIMIGGCTSKNNRPPEVTFKKIIDTDTSIPGARETFAGLAGAFDSGPAISDGIITFAGLGSSGLRGIFAYDGINLTKIADTRDLIPGQRETFSTDFGHPSIDGSAVAFVGGWGDESPAPWGSKKTGVYVHSENRLRTIADGETAVPGIGEVFKGYYGAVHKEGYTAFIGILESGQMGVYLSGGTSIMVIHDDKTALPKKDGGGSVEVDSAVVARGGDIPKSTPNMDTKKNEKTARLTGFAQSVAEASSNGLQVIWCAKDGEGNIGIFSYEDGKIDVIVDSTTLIPNGHGTFTDFGVRESLDNGDIAFVGFGVDDQAGVYALIEGELQAIADTNTQIPEGNGTFEHFSPFNDVAISNGNIVFTAAGANEQGGIYLYRNKDKSLWPIIQHADTLDGFIIGVNQRRPPIDDWWIQIPPLSLNFEGFDGRDIVFLVDLPDASGAIYQATISEL